MSSNQLPSLLKQGRTLQDKGDLIAAATVYAQVRTAAPEAFEGWHYGGMTALLRHRAGEAEQLLARALELNPASVETAMGLGVARIAKGDAPGAEAGLAALTTRQPQLAEAWHYLALAIETQGRFDDAIAARKRAVELDPRFLPGWIDLGSTLSTIARLTEALACFSTALRLDPNNVTARVGRAITLYKCHRVPETAAELAAVLNRDPGQFEAWSLRLLALNNLPQFTREQIFAEHQAYGRMAGAPVNAVWPNLPDPNRRLRVAFLSPDLREHSVAYFIEPLLQHLDRTAFEIVLYHDHAQVDHVSARLRGLAAIWRNFAGQVDAMVEPVVKADAPDVLVDLTGHAGTNRLRLLARRLAPVQINYLGYPNTTGIPAMDYRFVDAVTDPGPEADRFATEQLVRFAPTAWAYLPPASMPEVTPPPSRTDGAVTFASFNNFPKVTAEWLREWARILALVPNSRLLIKASGLGEPAVREPVLARLRASGLPVERVEVMPRTPDAASHFSLYGNVDVALDTFPYDGTTTTCEALWMGVPVVTCAGERHASRVGASLLTAIGRREWIADTADDYVRIAVALATDREKLACVRAGLREEMKRSTLLDHAAQARRFGTALCTCWTQWCEASRTSTGSPSALA